MNVRLKILHDLIGGGAWPFELVAWAVWLIPITNETRR